jgi:hypothetical protein
VAAASPSVWFPGFVDKAEREHIKTNKVYLSMGDKEKKTKNPVMATVGYSIRRLNQIYEEMDGDPGVPFLLWIMERVYR